MKPARQLTAPALDRAAAFLRQARPLERALFVFHFEGGAAAPAVDALQAFQNPDGGFQGLEADIGFPDSTVLSTCHALHLFRELGTTVWHPAVQRSLDYLVAHFDPSREVWPIIPPHDNTQPHAPWWHYSEKTGEEWRGLLDNPRPDVLACLQAFPAEQTGAVRARVTAATLARLRAPGGAIEMHGLLCYLRLHRAPNPSAELKLELDRVLPQAIAQAVERDPTKWTGYGLRPLDVAPLSDSPWRPLLAPAIEAHLDHLVEAQESDGSWHPHWNWGGSFPDAWPAAKLRWQAVLTLANLRTLRSYGRLSAG